MHMPAEGKGPTKFRNLGHNRAVYDLACSSGAVGTLSQLVRQEGGCKRQLARRCNGSADERVGIAGDTIVVMISGDFDRVIASLYAWFERRCRHQL